ncbi:MAG: elongation factor P [Acidobacteria bacterium]|nr:elongation factor P [Acidobacteriota bacterium]
MPPVSTNDLKTGMTLELDLGLVQVVDFQHVKPGKGHAFVRSTLKNVRTGAVVDRTFRSDEKVERAIIDKREMQFIYGEPDGLVFMDNETYEQMTVAAATLGDYTNFIIEGESVVLLMYGNEVVGCELPASVVLAVAQTDPGVQGDRVSGARKPATLQTGLVVQVPLFVETGDALKIDTRTAEYITRA